MTTALLLAALLAVPAAVERTDEQLRSTIEAYLGSIDTPITADHWKALGPRAALILEQLAKDHERLPTRRARSIEGLSFVGQKQHAKLMVSMAQSEDEPAVVRMSAMRGAGRMLGPHRLAAALTPVLESAKDAHVRASAAEVLAHRAPGAGCAAIAEQLQKEPAEKRLAFHRSIKACKLDEQ
jgi:hypothetical protein